MAEVPRREAVRFPPVRQSQSQSQPTAQSQSQELGAAPKRFINQRQSTSKADASNANPSSLGSSNNSKGKANSAARGNGISAMRTTARKVLNSPPAGYRSSQKQKKAHPKRLEDELSSPIANNRSQARPHGLQQHERAHGLRGMQAEDDARRSYSAEVAALVQQIKAEVVPRVNEPLSTALRHELDETVDSSDVICWQLLGSGSRVIYGAQNHGVEKLQAAIRGRLGRLRVVRIRAARKITDFLRLVKHFRENQSSTLLADSTAASGRGSGPHLNVGSRPQLRFCIYFAAYNCVRILAQHLVDLRVETAKQQFRTMALIRREAVRTIQSFFRARWSKKKFSAMWAFIAVAQKVQQAQSEFRRRSSAEYQKKMSLVRRQACAVQRLQKWVRQHARLRLLRRNQTKLLRLVMEESLWSLEQFCVQNPFLASTHCVNSGLTAVGHSIVSNKYASLRCLLALRPDVIDSAATSRDAWGRTALCLAVECGNATAVEALLNSNVSIESTTCRMAYERDTECFLIGSRAVSERKRHAGLCPTFWGNCLHIAADAKCPVQILKSLVQHALNSSQCTFAKKQTLEHFCSPHVESHPADFALRKWQDEGILLDCVSTEAVSTTNPVHVACYTNNKAALAILLRSGALPVAHANIADATGRSALHILLETQKLSSWTQKKEMTQMLLSAKANAGTVPTSDPLVCAILHRDPQFVRTLLSAKVDPNRRSRHAECSEIASEVDTFARSSFEDYPLVRALEMPSRRCRSIAAKCADALISYPMTNVNIRGLEHGWTPLLFATAAGLHRLIQRLIKAGAVPTRTPWADGSYSEFMLAALVHDWPTFRRLRRVKNKRFSESLQSSRNADNETVADFVSRIYGVESVDHLLATVEAHTFDLKEPDCIGFSQAQMYSISFQGDTSRGGLSIPLRSESEDKPAYTSALFKEHIFSGRCVSVVSQALQTAPDIQWDIVPPQIHLQNAVVHVPAIARTLQYFYQGNLEQPEFCFILQLEILRALVLCRQFRALNTAMLRAAEQEVENRSQRPATRDFGKHRRKSGPLVSHVVPQYITAMFERLSVIPFIELSARRKRNAVESIRQQNLHAMAAEQKTRDEELAMDQKAKEAAQREAAAVRQQQIAEAQRHEAWTAQQAETNRLKNEEQARRATAAATLLQAQVRGMQTRTMFQKARGALVAHRLVRLQREATEKSEAEAQLREESLREFHAHHREIFDRERAEKIRLLEVEKNARSKKQAEYVRSQLELVRENMEKWSSSLDRVQSDCELSTRESVHDERSARARVIELRQQLVELVGLPQDFIQKHGGSGHLTAPLFLRFLESTSLCNKTLQGAVSPATASATVALIDHLAAAEATLEVRICARDALSQDLCTVLQDTEAARKRLKHQQGNVTDATLIMLKGQPDCALELCHQGAEARKALYKQLGHIKERLREVVERYRAIVGASIPGINHDDVRMPMPLDDTPISDTSVLSQSSNSQGQPTAQRLAAACIAGDANFIHQIFASTGRVAARRLLTHPLDQPVTPNPYAALPTAATNRTAMQGDRLVHIAARAGHASCIVALCAVAKKTECVDQMVSCLTHGLETPLYLAIRFGHEDAAKALLCSGCRGIAHSLNTERYLSPIHASVVSGMSDVVEELLSCKASLEFDIQMDGRSSMSPLEFACQNGDISMVSVILKHHRDSANDKTLKSHGHPSPRTSSSAATQSSANLADAVLFRRFSVSIDDIEALERQGSTLVLRLHFGLDPWVHFSLAAHGPAQFENITAQVHSVLFDCITEAVCASLKRGRSVYSQNASLSDCLVFFNEFDVSRTGKCDMSSISGGKTSQQQHVGPPPATEKGSQINFFEVIRTYDGHNCVWDSLHQGTCASLWMDGTRKVLDSHFVLSMQVAIQFPGHDVAKYHDSIIQGICNHISPSALPQLLNPFGSPTQREIWCSLGIRVECERIVQHQAPLNENQAVSLAIACKKCTKTAVEQHGFSHHDEMFRVQDARSVLLSALAMLADAETNPAVAPLFWCNGMLDTNLGTALFEQVSNELLKKAFSGEAPSSASTVKSSPTHSSVAADNIQTKTKPGRRIPFPTTASCVEPRKLAVASFHRTVHKLALLQVCWGLQEKRRAQQCLLSTIHRGVFNQQQNSQKTAVFDSVMRVRPLFYMDFFGHGVVTLLARSKRWEACQRMLQFGAPVGKALKVVAGLSPVGLCVSTEPSADCLRTFEQIVKVLVRQSTSSVLYHALVRSAGSGNLTVLEHICASQRLSIDMLRSAASETASTDGFAEAAACHASAPFDNIMASLHWALKFGDSLFPADDCSQKQTRTITPSRLLAQNFLQRGRKLPCALSHQLVPLAAWRGCDLFVNRVMTDIVDRAADAAETGSPEQIERCHASCRRDFCKILDQATLLPPNAARANVLHVLLLTVQSFPGICDHSQLQKLLVSALLCADFILLQSLVHMAVISVECLDNGVSANDGSLNECRVALSDLAADPEKYFGPGTKGEQLLMPINTAAWQLHSLFLADIFVFDRVVLQPVTMSPSGLASKFGTVFGPTAEWRARKACTHHACFAAMPPSPPANNLAFASTRAESNDGATYVCYVKLMKNIRDSISEFLQQQPIYLRCCQMDSCFADAATVTGKIRSPSFDRMVSIELQRILGSTLLLVNKPCLLKTSGHTRGPPFQFALQQAIGELCSRHLTAQFFQERVKRADEQRLFTLIQGCRINIPTKTDAQANVAISVVDVKNFICKRRIAIECSNDRGETPLLQATALGNVALVKTLANEHNANMTVRDANGDDVFVKSIHSKSISMLGYLLSRPDLRQRLIAGPNTEERAYDNAFQAAVRLHSCPQLAELLFADVQDVPLHQCAGINSTGRCGLAPIHLAVLANAQTVGLMILGCSGIDVDTLSSTSRVSALYMACHSSSKFFVEKLLSYKANPCFQRRSNLTKVVDLGAQRHFSDNCLTWSCHSADLDIVRMILDAGATFSLLPSDTVAWTDTTKVDRKRRPAGYRKYLEFSPLFYAAFMGDFDILKCLLDAATTTKAAQTLQKNVGRGGNENFSGACNVVDLSTVGPHGETLEMLLFRVHRVSIDDCMRLARTLAHGPRQVTVVTQFEIIGRSEREDAPLADAMCSQSSFVTEEGASATYGPAARARAEKLFQSAFHSAAKVRHADVSTVLDMSPTLRAQYSSKRGDFAAFKGAVYDRLEQRCRQRGAFCAQVLHACCHRFLPVLLADWETAQIKQKAMREALLESERRNQQRLFAQDNRVVIEQNLHRASHESDSNHPVTEHQTLSQELKPTQNSMQPGHIDVETGQAPAAQHFDIRGAELRNVRALFLACQKNNASRARDIVQRRGVRVNVTNEAGFTPLMVATTHGGVDTVRAILSLKANAAAPHVQSGKTPLMMAAEALNLEIVKVLIEEAGVDPHARFDPNSLSHVMHADYYLESDVKGQTERGITAQELAQQVLSTKLLTKNNSGEQLLAYFADLPQAQAVLDPLARQQVHAHETNTEKAEGVLKKVRADAVLREAALSSALATAAIDGNVNVLRDLLHLSKEELSATKGGPTLLHDAPGGDKTATSTAPKVVVQVDCPDTRGRTALMHAVEARQIESVSLLLQAKSNPAQVDKERSESPLHIAARLGNVACLRLLLNALGSSPISIDSVSHVQSGESPLAVAALCGGRDYQRDSGQRLEPVHSSNYLTVLQLLLDQKASIRHNNAAALWNAVFSNNMDAVQLFFRNTSAPPAQATGSNSNQEFRLMALLQTKGFNSLQLAAQKGFARVVRLLSDRVLLATDFNARTAPAAGNHWAGLTALQIAVFRGYHGIVLLLFNSGAMLDTSPSLPTHLLAGFPPLSVTSGATEAHTDQRSKNEALDEMEFCVRVADFPMLSLIIQASAQQGLITSRRPAIDAALRVLHRFPVDAVVGLIDLRALQQGEFPDMDIDQFRVVLPTEFPPFEDVSNINMARHILERCGLVAYYGRPYATVLSTLTAKRLQRLSSSGEAIGEGTPGADAATHVSAVRWILGAYSFVKKCARDLVVHSALQHQQSADNATGGEGIHPISLKPKTDQPAKEPELDAMVELLCDAISDHNVERFDELLQHDSTGLLHNTPIKDGGFSPLMFAVEACNEHAVDRLLSLRADLDHRADNGASALCLCAQSADVRILDRLLLHGDPEPAVSTVEGGYSALHLAALDASTPITFLQTLAEYYRETGALEIKDSNGLTALDLAAQRGLEAWDVIDALIKVGASASAAALELHSSAREEQRDAE